MSTNITRRRALIGPLALSAIGASPWRSASARGWPTQTIKIVVGGGAGSVPDTLARLASDALATRLGRAVIVDNRPGAGGIVAVQALMGSPPDGYTIGLVTSAQAVFNSYLYSNLPYDPQRDLLAISTLVATSFVLAAHPAVPADTLADLVALSKRAASKIFIGVPAYGSPPHIAALLLMHETGLRADFVPFRSGPDALRAAMGGDIQLFIDGPTLVAPQVRERALKAIVVTGKHRQDMLAGVLTVAEAGFAKAECESWMGLVAPRGTASEVIAKLSHECKAITENEDYRRKLESLGFDLRSTSPEAFSTFIRQEHERWAGLLRTAGVKLD
jgi:tripartite-type tricarboxylate transporter receptor subunit TctC